MIILGAILSVILYTTLTALFSSGEEAVAQRELESDDQWPE